jgi:hypothetical protein
MKGKVDSWSMSAGSGTIVGDDGEVYAFAAVDVVEGAPTLPGAEVAFTTAGEGAARAASCVNVLRGVTLAAAGSGVVVTDVRLPFLSVAWLVFQVAVVSVLLSLAGALLLTAIRVAVAGSTATL